MQHDNWTEELCLYETLIFNANLVNIIPNFIIPTEITSFE